MSATPPRNTTLSELAKVISNCTELGYDKAALRIRTVAVKADGKWSNFGTQASLIEPEQLKDDVTKIREDVALVESWASSRGLTGDSLQQVVAGWRRLLGSQEYFPFQGQVSLYREHSLPNPMVWPGWRTELYEQIPNAASIPLPDGPFLNREKDIFAQDMTRLAVGYLDASNFSARQNEYRVWIPDRRVRITGLTANDNELAIKIERKTSEPLFFCVTALSFSNKIFEKALPLEGLESKMRLPFSAQSVTIWVSLADGYPLDHYEETPHRASWGAEESLFNASRSRSVQLVPIEKALASGENESIEFKPYIRLKQRNSKADEILETLSAFSNASGGDLCMGVNDYGEPVGCDIELIKDYGEECRDVLQCRQDAYVRDFKKLIAAGLRPILSPEFHWHDFGNTWILQVRISKAETPVGLIATSEVYRRVSATNRKLRPWDELVKDSEPSSGQPKLPF